MRFERSIIAAFFVACAVLLAGAVSFTAAVQRLEYYLAKEPIEIRSGLDTMPLTLGRWQRVGTDSRFGKEVIEELGTAQYLDRAYALDGDANKGVVSVHLAYYTGTIEDVPHVPERCSVVHGNQIVRGPTDVPLKVDQSGWKQSGGVKNRATGLEYPTAEVADPVTLRRTTVHLPVGDYVMKVTEFQNPRQPRKRMVAGYLFIANARLTPSAYGVRALAFSRTERFAYYCKVQISIEAEIRDKDGSLFDTFVATAESILGSIVPPLMVRLPDWPTVEKAAESPASGATRSPTSAADD